MDTLKHTDFEKHNDKYEVSIVLVTYNHVNFIEQALNSALNQQTNFKFQICVIDDHSTDGTSELVAKISQQYDNVKHILAEENKGIANNNILHFNEFLPHIDTKYIALLSGDDYWINTQKLQKQYDILEKNPDAVVTACSYHFGENREMIHEDKKHNDLFFSQGSTLFLRNVIDFTRYPGILRDDSGYRFIYHLYGTQISTSHMDVYYRVFDKEEDKEHSSLYVSQENDIRRRYNYYVIAIGFGYILDHKINYNILNFDREGFSEFVIDWAKNIEYGEHLVSRFYVSTEDKKYLDIIKSLDTSTLPPRSI